ncbi:hypothetical protein [Rhizobium leguminosarum]|uniref:hypothetical protein n=1 Tax=Rhizobium leguminosarum TaxID=384 RepID=UPI0013DD62DA|nr:hypothetical protein [Rhizobium leguminosarum]
MTKITLLHPSPRWLQHAPERSWPFEHPASASNILIVPAWPATQSAPLTRSSVEMGKFATLQAVEIMVNAPLTRSDMVARFRDGCGLFVGF